MRRKRKAKIVATLGSPTKASDKIKTLLEARTDMLHLNFSHDPHDNVQITYADSYVKSGNSLVVAQLESLA